MKSLRLRYQNQQRHADSFRHDGRIQCDFIALPEAVGWVFIDPALGSLSNPPLSEEVCADVLRWVLALFGYKFEYVSEYGTHDTRYSSLDHVMGRPCHPHLRVAPPWAKMRIVRDVK